MFYTLWNLYYITPNTLNPSDAGLVYQFCQGFYLLFFFLSHQTKSIIHANGSRFSKTRRSKTGSSSNLNFVWHICKNNGPEVFIATLQQPQPCTILEDQLEGVVRGVWKSKLKTAALFFWGNTFSLKPVGFNTASRFIQMLLINSDAVNVYGFFILLSLVFFMVFLGYQSATCEQKVNLCTSNPCHNNGTCHPGPIGFGCSCPAGFTGPTCAQLVNFCALNPCAHGVCRSVGNNYRCLCVPGEQQCQYVNVNK